MQNGDGSKKSRLIIGRIAQMEEQELQQRQQREEWAKDAASMRQAIIEQQRKDWCNKVAGWFFDLSLVVGYGCF